MKTGSALVLVLEDEPLAGRLMKAILEAQGWRVVVESEGARGLEQMRKEAPGLVFLDLGLADMHGLDVLAAIKESWPRVPVIILTGDTGVPSAVKAIQLGAFNYFTKPVDNKQIEAAARSALERADLLQELDELRGRLRESGRLAALMGPSAAVARLQDQVLRVADTPFSVLVQGETGAGKDLVARAIHDSSPRAKAPFIALDCGAIPEALLESELFGYERGAFTGAERRREGHFQMAQGGTVFLDEIANLPLGPQAKLLRVLQERQVLPLGGQKAVAVNIRIIAASNHDLEQEVQAGRFRQDLFFRLAEFKVLVPPLRERPEDIGPLAQRFLEEARVELRRPLDSLEPEALERLREHAWPGNVRELRNVIRQATLLSQGPLLGKAVIERILRPLPQDAAKHPASSALSEGLSLTAIGRAGRDRAEREAISEALRRTQGNILSAARTLKVDNKTLHVKLKRHGIHARDFEPED